MLSISSKQLLFWRVCSASSDASLRIPFFSFFLEKKRNKKLFAAFILFLMELMRALRLVQGQPIALPKNFGVCPAFTRQKPQIYSLISIEVWMAGDALISTGEGLSFNNFLLIFPNTITL
jgi:hypothetical protein